jgi:hypothetical protein
VGTRMRARIERGNRLGPARLVRTLAAITAVVCAFPVAARAGQIVYPDGTGIWVMNDDGSGRHELVDATQVPDVSYIGNPSVQPNGTEVAFQGVWSQAQTEMGAYGPGFCGGNCEAVYELRGGSVTRITGAPFDCPGERACASYEFDPRVASDGSVPYVFQVWVSEPDPLCIEAPCQQVPVLGQSALLSRDADGGDQEQWQTTAGCNHVSDSNQQVTDADVLAPNPADPDEIAYANCKETASNDACPFTWTSAYDSYRSGASRSDSSDDVLLNSDADPGAECLQDAGTRIWDLDFSPDSKSVVEIHGGAGAGIWTYPATGGGPARELLAIPASWYFYSVRYLSSTTIAFSAGVDTNHDGSPDRLDIYTIPTNCTPATCDIAASQGVTDLTRDGQVSYDYITDTANFGHTTSMATISAVRGSGGGGSGGSGGAGGSGGSGGGSRPLSLARIPAQHLASLRRHGLTAVVSCPAACRLRASLLLSGARARALHLEPRHGPARPLVIGAAGKRLHHAGRASLVIRVGRRAAARLSRAVPLRLTLRLTTTGAAGRRTLTRTVRVTR